MPSLVIVLSAILVLWDRPAHTESHTDMTNRYTHLTTIGMSNASWRECNLYVMMILLNWAKPHWAAAVCGLCCLCVCSIQTECTCERGRQKQATADQSLSADTWLRKHQSCTDHHGTEADLSVFFSRLILSLYFTFTSLCLVTLILII